LNFIMASNISVGGITPASLSSVAFTKTITRIVLLLMFAEAGSAFLPTRRTGNAGIDRPCDFF
jgi:hypothetical protein